MPSPTKFTPIRVNPVKIIYRGCQTVAAVKAYHSQAEGPGAWAGYLSINDQRQPLKGSRASGPNERAVTMSVRTAAEKLGVIFIEDPMDVYERG